MKFLYTCRIQYSTGWRKPITCLKLHVVSRKKATNHRALLREMTYKHEVSYGSSSPCTVKRDTDSLIVCRSKVMFKKKTLHSCYLLSSSHSPSTTCKKHHLYLPSCSTLLRLLTRPPAPPLSSPDPLLYPLPSSSTLFGPSALVSSVSSPAWAPIICRKLRHSRRAPIWLRYPKKHNLYLNPCSTLSNLLTRAPIICSRLQNIVVRRYD